MLKYIRQKVIILLHTNTLRTLHITSNETLTLDNGSNSMARVIDVNKSRWLDVVANLNLPKPDPSAPLEETVGIYEETIGIHANKIGPHAVPWDTLGIHDGLAFRSAPLVPYPSMQAIHNQPIGQDIITVRINKYDSSSDKPFTETRPRLYMPGEPSDTPPLWAGHSHRDKEFLTLVLEGTAANHEIEPEYDGPTSWLDAVRHGFATDYKAVVHDYRDVDGKMIYEIQDHVHGMLPPKEHTVKYIHAGDTLHMNHGEYHHSSNGTIDGSPTYSLQVRREIDPRTHEKMPHGTFFEPLVQYLGADPGFMQDTFRSNSHLAGKRVFSGYLKGLEQYINTDLEINDSHQRKNNMSLLLHNISEIILLAHSTNGPGSPAFKEGHREILMRELQIGPGAVAVYQDLLTTHKGSAARLA